MSLDKKLNQVYQNGYEAGCERTHENWMQALRETPGIGAKRREQIMQAMERICREKVMCNGEDHQT